ncbi:hypothetical protein [Amantichitinum ursilacus]|uniref:Pilus assembly protein, PilO n=1 Tax=Amantichitinum ursilacus TaxID=857265 RepID=A0A0N0XMR5_9NEIS|nr:hypothetical protein [Amantichitinum ursilacus]KPC54448.1 hypothetical protein WG78_02690 [Amantichitinum ursilacus]
MNSARLLWWMRQWPRQAGLLGWVGLALMLAGWLIYRQQVVPVSQDLDRREIAIDSARHQLRLAAQASAAAAAAPAPLDTPDQFTDMLRQLTEMANAHHVAITQSEYKSVSEGDGHLMRFGIQFPAQGRYPDLRGLVADLQALPGVRVESLMFSRSQIGDDNLTAQLTLSYLTEVR